MVDNIKPVIDDLNTSVSNIFTTSFIINLTGTAVDLERGLSTNPYSYQISIDGINRNSVCNSNSNLCEANSLLSNQVYNYRVCVYDNSGNSNCTDSKQVIQLLYIITINI